jgi:hypothetical protein
LAAWYILSIGFQNQYTRVSVVQKSENASDSYLEIIQVSL